MAHNEGKTSFYLGAAGSERGELVNRELRPWGLLDTSPLLKPEKKLLERIVSMHNQVVSYIHSAPHIPA